MIISGKRKRQAEALIVALLSHDSISAAASAAKISESTALRWLQDPDFQRDYRAARRSVVEQSMAAIQSAMCDAVKTLIRNLHCEKPNVEVSAACALVNMGVKGVELVDIEERLAVLESLYAAKGGK